MRSPSRSDGLNPRGVRPHGAKRTMSLPGCADSFRPSCADVVAVRTFLYRAQGTNMLIFDWHLDLSWNALEWNRDLTLPVEEIRRREVAAQLTGRGRGTNTVSLPALRVGNVAVVS